MTVLSTKGSSTQNSRVIRAARKAVYQALVDQDALTSWLPPETMTGQVHVFESCESGRFRMSLTYQNADHSRGGMTSEHTDTVQAEFVDLLQDEKIDWVVEFESHDPEFAGEMKLSFIPADATGGTEDVRYCTNFLGGVPLEDKKVGCRSSLKNLAALLE
jgi:uncharacterized protein YndB with AHSA1/START domain